MSLGLVLSKWHLVFFTCAMSVTADIEMEFTQWPESATAPVGYEVSFECTVRVPGERLAWRYKPVVPEDGPWIDIQDTGSTDKVSSKLPVKIKEEMEDAFYQCVVWYGAVSLASVPGRLTVARIDLTRNTAEKRVITAPVKNTVVMHCRAPLSEPPAVLTWWKDDKGKRRSLDTPHGVMVLSNVTSEDSGAYSCTATNELSGQSLDLPERTYLRVQQESLGGVRFLESEDYVGVINNEGVLTAPVLPNDVLRLYCGVVGTPQPEVTWSKDGGPLPARARRDGGQLVVAPFREDDEGIYSCSAGGLRRAWKVVSLEPAHWEGSAGSVNGTEGGGARVSCGTPLGEPQPHVYWLLNALPITEDRSIKTTGSEMFIERVEKRHAGIVQCFACNRLGCAYDAALLTVVPVQISDQEYSAESAKNLHFPSQPPKRHFKKNSRKHKGEPLLLIPPSRPNVTRMSDESVMLSWSNEHRGLPILFFKVQYREATNTSNGQWHTESEDISPYIHSYEVRGLIPDKFYKFRIAAVYSNQDNKQGKSSTKFYLQRGGFLSPRAPILTRATALSPSSIQLEWTSIAASPQWSSDGGVAAEGFYVYYRTVSSAGEYEKVTAGGGAYARSLVLSHLLPDTAYELKLQAYTAQAPSDFTSISIAKTLKPLNQATSTTEAPRRGMDETGSEASSGGALATAGGAGVAILAILLVAFLLCRRARRMSANAEYKEKGSVPEGGAGNGYIPAKVPITITANPMHAENGDSGVEMSYMHNNNTGTEDNTLSHSRKNGTTPRQYV